jgi:hypothetical protein
MIIGANDRLISVISSTTFGDGPDGPFTDNVGGTSSILLYEPVRTEINFTA